MDKKLKLHEDILKILIFSYYENEQKGRGETANEIMSFERRAIDAYLSDTWLCRRVNKDAALIRDAIEGNLRWPAQGITT